MVSPKGTFLILAIAFLPACVSDQDTRRNANREQVEAFLTMQAKQNHIEEFARSLSAVGAVTVYLRTDSVIVKMYLKPGVALTPADQEQLNAFITKRTGIPRERIHLYVPESSVPGLRRDE
jgi:hypothetical protein